MPQSPYRVKEGRLSARQLNAQDLYRGKCDLGPACQVSLSLGVTPSRLSDNGGVKADLIRVESKHHLRAVIQL